MNKKKYYVKFFSKVPDETNEPSFKGKTWGPSTIHQLERVLPSLRPSDQHNLMKSAPNLDNKSRSTTSKSTEDMLGNSVEHFHNRVSSEAQLSTMNHHYTNISASSHTRFFDNNEHLNARNDDDDEKDHSDHSTTVGCFSFVSGHGSERKKKYKKLQKASPTDHENRTLLASSSERKLRKNKRFNKPTQFPVEVLTRKINNDMIFYRKFEEDLVAVGTKSELNEDDYIYIRSKLAKNKNKSDRLLQSLDAIDAYDDEELSQGGGNRHVKIYSKSFDNLSIADEFQFERNGSQFTRECFLKNGVKTSNGDVVESESSDDDDTHVYSHRQY